MPQYRRKPPAPLTQHEQKTQLTQRAVAAEELRAAGGATDEEADGEPGRCAAIPPPRLPPAGAAHGNNGR